MFEVRAYTHRQRHMLLFEVCTCVYVCDLHNARVKVSRLIFYLSAQITVAFTAALASVHGVYSISPESLLGEKKAACLQSIQGSHKMLQLQMLPVLKVFYSILPHCRKQQKQQS